MACRGVGSRLICAIRHQGHCRPTQGWQSLTICASKMGAEPGDTLFDPRKLPPKARSSITAVRCRAEGYVAEDQAAPDQRQSPLLLARVRHCFNYQTGVAPPKDIDVILVAPRGDYLTENSFRISKYDDELKAAMSSEPTIVNNLLYRSYKEKEDFEEDTFLDLYIYQTGKKLGKRATAVENSLKQKRS